MDTVIERTDTDKADSDELTLTLKFRGTADAVIGALVNGLPREALVGVAVALDKEMRKRGIGPRP